MMMFHIYIKKFGCQGSGCLRCEDFFPGFINEHGGDYEFSKRVLRDPERQKVFRGMIEECPSNVIAWGRVKQ